MGEQNDNIDGAPLLRDQPSGGPGQQAIDFVSRIVAAIELTPMVAVLSIDRSGVVCYWNQASAALYGIPAEQALGCQLEQLVQPDGRADDYHAAIAAVWHSGQPSPAHDWHMQTTAGRQLWIYSTMFPVFRDGQLQQIFRMDVDITARKRQERTLHLAAQVFESSRDAIVLTDPQQTVLLVNQAYSSVTGYAAAEIVGQSLALHRSGIEDEARYQQIWAEIGQAGHWQGEVWAQRKDGQRYPAWLSLTALRDRAGHISNYMGILSDISDLKQSEAHTRHLAEHDFLTDLPNRVLLRDRLSLALTAARRNHSMLAILFLDLDRFKQVNDTLGHHTGDLLLQEVAARLVRCVRGADTVSRQGGDEFVIMLADISAPDQAAHVADSILQAIAQPVLLEPHRLSVSTSIGISIYPDDGSDIDTLLKNADVAMYHAKENGRNSLQFFSPQMNALISERASFAQELRRALERQEFVLEYQAEIDIASGQPCGAEALIRWRHPRLGLLLPERFIGVAEDNGLMLPIGHWVLQQACLAARRWQTAGYPLVVAVNLSPAQFMQKDLVDTVQAALQQSGLAAPLLELELTEALIMKQGGAALATLKALRGLGVRLTIDDFGTGYSRLGHLQDYPVDKLKIDRSLVAAIVANGDGAPRTAAVSAIIALARTLQMKVVAEGVETPDQLQFLRQHGCDLYQGNYARRAGQLDGLSAVLGAVEP
ncbi:MAG: putative bifunctional diguanylate cyclase/phosphodiesterase [Sphingomonadaceae bacterium]